MALLPAAVHTKKNTAWGEPHVEWTGVGVSRHGLAPHRGPQWEKRYMGRTPCRKGGYV